MHEDRAVQLGPADHVAARIVGGHKGLEVLIALRQMTKEKGLKSFVRDLK
jgi:hypothetical protein